MTWRVGNDGAELLRLEDAWIPHSRFRGEGHVALSAVIDAGASRTFDFVVTANEPPLTVVENAFLILRASECRIFVKLRVEFDHDGTPTPIVEAVTSQSLQ